MLLKRITIGWVLALVGLAAACAPQPAPTQTSGESGQALENTHWQLVSFDTPDSETPVVAGSEVTLLFDESGGASGSAGCNSYGGVYQVDQGRLVFSELVNTLMACTEATLMDQEAQYLRALQSAGTFELSAERLLIHYGDEQSTLNFVKINE
jgi:heat shock protein HslJ